MTLIAAISVCIEGVIYSACDGSLHNLLLYLLCSLLRERNACKCVRGITVPVPMMNHHTSQIAMQLN